MHARRLASSLVLVVFAGSAPLRALPLAAQEALCTAAAPSLHSAWETAGGKTQVLFEEREIVLRKDGALSVAKILSREPCKLRVRYQGLRSIWTIVPGEGSLELRGAEAMPLRPLATVPPELDVNLPTFPKPAAVTPAEVKSVEGELLGRVKNDQETLKDPARRANRPAIMADNLRYLRDLTHRVGWIDIPRFGKNAASAAILIAKHGSDLLLMKAALPIVERDVKEHGGSGEMFSVLYDEFQITLGNQQRYGTQIDSDQQGHPYILPLEDPARVDQYRKEIGILSFQEYLKLASDNMGGAQLRVAESNE